MSIDFTGLQIRTVITKFGIVFFPDFPNDLFFPHFYRAFIALTCPKEYYATHF